jgi:transcriptional regulator with PAS, ATPase and Fis domain
MQSKLLRVLQENTFYRVGGTEQISTNVRVVCANNVPLRQLIDEGKFREDLYYRLNICLIDVPPLRERVEDIQCLSDAFIKSYSKRYGIEKSISSQAQQRLNEYHWPGNVRELENIVHRLYIAQPGDVIDSEDVDEILGEGVYDKIMVNMKKEFQRDQGIDFTLLMEEQERKIIQYALEKEGTTRKAADFLNIPQTTFVRKKNKYKI